MTAKRHEIRDDYFVQRVMGRIAEYEQSRQSKRRFWLGWCPPAVAFALLCAVAMVPGETPASSTSAALLWLSGEPAATGAATTDPEFETLAFLALE